MDVSVIIVNYNTCDFLCEAIDSVFKFTESVNYELIVVDNASKDDSIRKITEKYGSKVLYISLSENVGFGKANNEGVKISKGRNLFFLNPDTALLNNAINILSRYLDENPDTGIVGGNLYDANMTPAYSYRRFLPSLFWEINDLFLAFPEKMIFGKKSHFNYTSKALRVAYVTGADMMMSRKIFEKAGCFDPDYFLYCEESDLACKVRKSGYLIKSVPQARIMHLEGISFISSVSRNIHYFNGKLLFYRKNSSPFKIFLIKFTMFFTFYTRITAFSILQNKKKIQFWRSAYNAYKIAESTL